MVSIKNQYEAAKDWSAAHVVIAIAAGGVIGFAIHALLF